MVHSDSCPWRADRPRNTPGVYLDIAGRVDRGERVEASKDEPDAWNRDRALALRRLDWSIRVLHCGIGETDVHGAFITKDLLGVDNLEARWTLPRGVGTLWIASQLTQGCGGKIVIHGDRAKGHDIRWAPITGGVALVECKDRAWQAGSSESHDDRLRYIVGKIHDAGRGFPDQPGARVLSVGFYGYVPSEEADAARDALQSGLDNWDWSRTLSDPNDLPDYLAVQIVGMDENYNMTCFTHCVDMARERPDWLRVAPVFERMFTVEGRRRLPEPWPIIE